MRTSSHGRGPAHDLGHGRAAPAAGALPVGGPNPLSARCLPLRRREDAVNEIRILASINHVNVVR